MQSKDLPVVDILLAVLEIQRRIRHKGRGGFKQACQQRSERSVSAGDSPEEVKVGLESRALIGRGFLGFHGN
jgi:hypothetical protein